MSVLRGTSHVTMLGALSPLRDGEIIRDGDYGWRESWYIGGQSQLSWTRAWQLLESLLDEPGRWIAHRPFGTPHHCASVRFGNCLSIEMERVRT